MSVDKVCQEYIRIDKTILGLCLMPIPCSQNHMTEEDMADWRRAVEEHIARLEAEYLRMINSERGDK